MPRKLWLLFIISLFPLLSSFNVSAHLALSEYRLYFDNNAKTNALTLRNTSNTSMKYTIELTQSDMTEQGTLIPVTDAQTKGRSAKTLLRFSPRRGEIKPQGIQAVRFSVRKPASLADGEYRSVLRISGQIVNSPTSKNVGTRSTLAYNIPVIIRQGKLAATASLATPTLIMQNGVPTIELWLTRQGKRSLYGDFTITDSNHNKLAELTGVAIYPPLLRRKVDIPLTKTGQGKVTIKFQEQSHYGGNLTLTNSIILK